MSDSRRLTIMMKVADTARADLALTADRIYYRFATDESIEDGDLPAAKEDFDNLTSRLIEAAQPKEGETPLSSEIKTSIFISNRISDISLTEQSLKRLVGELYELADEFAFLKGFV